MMKLRPWSSLFLLLLVAGTASADRRIGTWYGTKRIMVVEPDSAWTPMLGEVSPVIYVRHSSTVRATVSQRKPTSAGVARTHRPVRDRGEFLHYYRDVAGRTFAIGDIHGDLAALQTLFARLPQL